MSKFFKTIIIAAVGIFLASPVWAATISLSPASSNAVNGCQKIIEVLMSTAGANVNGAQIFVDHNLSLAGESIVMSGSGGVFESYGNPSGLPAGVAGLYGYGANVNGENLVVGRIVLQSGQAGKTINLTVRVGAAPTSKAADADTSENVLTSATGASVSVVAGSCETTKPTIENVVPAHQTPNYPVDSNITFDIKDTGGSGVDINTLQVNVSQTGWNGAVNVTWVKQSDDWYKVTVQPSKPFISERKVDWSVSVADNAGNDASASYYFNNLTCAALGCVAGADPQPDCNDGADNDGDSKIDYPADAGCDSLTDNNEYVAECNDDLDNNSNGLIDFDGNGDITKKDLGCSNADDNTEFSCDNNVCEAPITPQCSDGLDNDGDGKTDLADSACSGPSDNNEYVLGDVPAEIVTIPGSSSVTTEYVTQCNDGLDNDSDDVIDYPADSDCQSANDTSEYEIPAGSLLTPENLRFYFSNYTIPLALNSYNVLPVLANSNIAIGIDMGDVITNIKSVKLRFKDTDYSLFYHNGLKIYAVDLMAPGEAGLHPAAVMVEYGQNKKETILFSVAVVSQGLIAESSASGTQPLANVTVAVEQLGDDNDYHALFSSATDNQGKYGFVVPNGNYRLRLSADGYRSALVSGVAVSNHIINYSTNLFRSVNLLANDVSVSEKIKYVGQVAGDNIGNIARAVVDQQTKNVIAQDIAPVAAAATAAMVVPALSMLNLLSYLRFLFLQPVLLLGRKRRKEWGLVYNSLTKLPVDLAIVRLIDANTDQIIQTRVTDPQGRYVFFTEPGLYRVLITMPDYIFPTKIMQDLPEDTGYIKIYHGEPIHVEAPNTFVAVNIPLDPVGARKLPRRLVWEKFLRSIQYSVARFSVVAGFVSFAITPTKTVGVLLVAQVALYFVFRRFVKPKPASGWGAVYDHARRKPIKNAVARLFSKRFDKLVASELTDGQGQYAFLAGPGEYYVTFDKPGYKQGRSRDIIITNTADEVVKVDVALDRE